VNNFLKRKNIPPKLKTIAFVNDDLLIMTAYASQIKDEGYTIRILLGGEKALVALSQSEPPDLILCDYSMPGMTGIEFLDRLKKEQPDLFHGSRIIGFSSHSEDSEVAHEFRRLGLEYTEKTTIKAELIEFVLTHLNRRQLGNIGSQALSQKTQKHTAAMSVGKSADTKSPKGLMPSFPNARFKMP